jgi:hypothetical protein
MMQLLSETVSAIGHLAPLRNLVNGAVERYRDDNAALEVLRGRENVFRALKGCHDATGVVLISKALNGRDPNKIQKSLLRLERKDKVHKVPGGWRFGPIPQRIELVLKFASS